MFSYACFIPLRVHSSYSDHIMNYQGVSFTTCEGTCLKHSKQFVTGPQTDSVCSTGLKCPTSQVYYADPILLPEVSHTTKWIL